MTPEAYITQISIHYDFGCVGWHQRLLGDGRKESYGPLLSWFPLGSHLLLLDSRGPLLLGFQKTIFFLTICPQDANGFALCWFSDILHPSIPPSHIAVTNHFIDFSQPCHLQGSSDFALPEGHLLSINTLSYFMFNHFQSRPYTK